MRASAALAGAVLYAAALLYLAASGAGDLVAPLSRAVTIGVPLAAAGIASLASSSPRWHLLALGTVGAVALGAGCAITAGWLPFVWLEFVWPWIVASTLVGGAGFALIANPRVRYAAVAACAVAPLIAGRFDPGPATVDAAISVNGSREIQAPAHEVWETLVDPEFAAAGARMADPEEPERLRIAYAPVTVEPARAFSAWQGTKADGWVVPTVAAYDIIPSGDSAATLSGIVSYQLAVHTRALPASWVRTVADRLHAATLDSLRARSEVRSGAEPPRLTAEMRRLRAEIDTVWREQAERLGDGDVALALFINGEMRAETPQGQPDVQETMEGAATALRTALQASSARARTTVWLAAVGTTARLEYEDYHGRCIAEVAPDRSPSAAAGLAARGQLSRCEGTAMVERARRSRMIVRLALEAGQPDDRWSIAPLVRGETRVYLDSVVFRADTVRLTGKEGSVDSPVADSIFAGLSVKTERAWFVSRRASALPVNRAFKPGDVWERHRLRFSIPVDSSFDLTKAWPTFEVVMARPKTAEDPYGRAWTYAHAPMAYFSGVRR